MDRQRRFRYVRATVADRSNDLVLCWFPSGSSLWVDMVTYVLFFDCGGRLERIEDDDWVSIVRDRVQLAECGIKTFLIRRKDNVSFESKSRRGNCDWRNQNQGAADLWQRRENRHRRTEKRQGQQRGVAQMNGVKQKRNDGWKFDYDSDYAEIFATHIGYGKTMTVIAIDRDCLFDDDEVDEIGEAIAKLLNGELDDN
jgi:hypothetical protein